MPPIDHVLILGAGWVGRQVAARMARFGVDVWLLDREESVSKSAVAWMRRLGEFPDDRNWISRVRVASSLADLNADETRIDLVLESVPEQISLKRRVLREVGTAFPPPTIIASNSSYFLPSTLGRFVEQPSRFAHMHFHVPVLSNSVVDIVGCEQTQPAVLQQLRSLANRIGQEPLLLRREHPGYIFNWLLQSVLRSALELAALDVADPQDIDKSWKAVTGMPLGPFGIMDRIGLDVIEQILSNARWAEPPGVPVEQLLALLSAHTSQGELGVKAGRGFYEHPPASAAARDPSLSPLEP